MHRAALSDTRRAPELNRSSRPDLARSRRASLIVYIMVMAVNAMTTQKDTPFTCATSSPDRACSELDKWSSPSD